MSLMVDITEYDDINESLKFNLIEYQKMFHVFYDQTVINPSVLGFFVDFLGTSHSKLDLI